MAALTDSYDAAIDRALQGLAEAVGVPVEVLRAAPTSGDWLRARAETIEAFTQPHRDRAARFVGAMQDAVEQAMVLDRVGELDWQTSEDAAETARVLTVLEAELGPRS